MGDRAVLIECANGPQAVAIAGALTDSPAPGQRELVPGARSVLLTADRPIDAAALAARLQMFDLHSGAAAEAEAVTIDVVYDGADLAEVARLTGLGRDGVIAAHTGTPWRVAFTGFAPGFGYLTGGDPRLAVPRQATPRAEVPAGAVGLAGEFSGVYPRTSPGGWQLIGSTNAVLWDTDRDPPALLRPGTVVRFRAVPALPVGYPPARHGPSSGTRSEETPRHSRTVTVIRPGISCLVEDLGRPGLAAQGVGRSGAADRGAARRANRIVGNRVGAAVLELIPGRVEVLAGGALLVAVTGAAADVAVDGVPAGRDVPIALSEGRTLTIGPPRAGLRCYLSVRGGIAAPLVLGSRSTDLLTGLGPPAVRAGDVLAVGHDHWGTPRAVQPPKDVRFSGNAAPAGSIGSEGPEIEVFPGPQTDWFDGGLAALTEAGRRVLPASNRVGVRLDGPPLLRVRDGEVASQGLLPGAIQVPPDGRPVIVFADHPVTGGYPIVAVVATSDLDLLAQLRPGRSAHLRAGRSAGAP